MDVKKEFYFYNKNVWAFLSKKKKKTKKDERLDLLIGSYFNTLNQHISIIKYYL